MTTPVTSLDTRFSAPDAVATSWDETRSVLETAELFWISTVRADGRPHVTPLVAVWVDGALHFTTGPGEQKALNMTGNRHVILTTGCNGWDEGLDVVVEGDAARVTDDDTLNRLAAAWSAKWDGRWKWRVRDGCYYQDDDDVSTQPTHVFSVAPAKVLAFAKGTFGHTRHTF
ncbi:MAG TPA: pyridoxamine 5'-phosphate oxidase family protein [Gaiellales bacterium]|jgi:nitroimidazol reductase NimA-like FMN-containing flavoprotein (pyridoxamine 5'-phosphate oxidase superfamily)